MDGHSEFFGWHMRKVPTASATPSRQGAAAPWIPAIPIPKLQRLSPRPFTQPQPLLKRVKEKRKKG